MQAIVDLVARATGITCHSGEIDPGNIFVAIRGRITDGNTFAAAAAERGAAAVVSDCPERLPPLSIPIITVANARLALAELAAAFYNNPSRSMNLIGVTGSNGKTTIACMLEHIFKQNGLTAGLIGTVRVNNGKITFPSILTTPDAVSIQQYLSQMIKNNVTHAAMEVSAQGIDMHRVANVKFSAGILSNICADHLDFHGDFTSYIEAKAKFLDLLDDNTPLIVNIGDPYCQTIARNFSGRLTAAIGNNQADISATIIHLSTYGSSFDIHINKPLTTTSGRLLAPQKYRVALAIPGRHNIENALLATAAAVLNDISLEAISLALTSFHSVERRMNIFHLEGITAIDDTALNPGSIDAVFDTIDTFRYNRLVVVNAIRGRRGPAINAANAAAIASWQQKIPFKLIVTSSLDHVGTADIVTSDEKLAFLSTLNTFKTEYTYTSTLPNALSVALNHTAPGDLLMLIGAQGMDAGRRVLTELVKAYHSHSQSSSFYLPPAWSTLGN